MSGPRPQLIGLPTRLRLVEPIGRGSSSVVWRVRDTRDGLDLAVKIVSVTAGRDPELLAERVEREARAMSRLRGLSGVVSLHEVGRTADGDTWMIMDIAAGGTLRDRVAEDRSGDAMSEVAVDTMARALATSLAHAHDLGVVHGDISPANVLFAADGSSLLADFGMSSLRGGGAGTVGIAGFTPAYAAPERQRGSSPDGPSDVFALAATLWHAATGAPPTRDIASGIAIGANPTAQPADLSPPLLAVLRGAMAESPSRRHDAVMLAASLGAVAADLPAAPATDRPRRLRRRWR